MISVVIPVYNAAPYLKECLDSVLQAAAADFEIIVVDDGSTDQSPALCRAYQKKEPRIRLLVQPNQGVSSARNHGLAAAQGKWVAFVDADDTLPAGSLEKAAALAERWEADVLMGGYQIPGEAKPHLPDLNGPALYTEKDIDRLRRFFVAYAAGKENREFRSCPNLLSPWGKVFRREMLQKVTFREELTLDEDALFNLDALDRARRVLVVPEVLYVWRQTPGSLSRGKAGQQMIHKQAQTLSACREYAERHPELDLSGELAVRALWGYIRCLQACGREPGARQRIRTLMEQYREPMGQGEIEAYDLPWTMKLHWRLAQQNKVWAAWGLCVVTGWKHKMLGR